MMPAIAASNVRRTRRVALAAGMPGLLELLAVGASIALLVPGFAQISTSGAGRDGRFAEAAFRVESLPDAVLPAACAGFASHAEAVVRERLCASVREDSPSASTLVLPAALGDAAARAAEAFVAPVRAAESRLDAVRLRHHNGDADVRETADAIAAIEAEAQPFVERFHLTEPGALRGPAPLACAMRWVEAALAESGPPAMSDIGHDMARANVVLLLAAALDGRASTESVANTAVLPVIRRRSAPPCAESGVESLAATAAVMEDARQSVSNARKNEATVVLMKSAGWQWAGAMVLGFGMLLWSRRTHSPAIGVSCALALWALAAWFARVPWPLAGNRNFQPARLAPALWSPPATFVLWIGATAAMIFVWALSTPRRPSATAFRAAETLSSRVGYAGLVLACGLGWLLLLELSANGNPGNRYLSLYHQGHLWLGMLIFSVLVFVRRPLVRELGWLLSISGEAVRSATSRLGPAGAGTALALVGFGAVVGLGLTLSNMRQLTSELGRMWLIVGAAWFFFLRAGPLTERLAHSGRAGLSFWRYAWPMLFVVTLLVAAMLITRDMGPLLIAGYASGAFLAATVAMWWHQRSGQRASAFLLAVLFFAAWIGMVTVALFTIGAVDSLTEARLESVAAPYASANDQLALVAWFQRAAPREGFGIGAVPWCGYAPAGRCSGVPAQIHSDYTFSAIVGVFGAAAAWTAAVGCAVWLHRLIRHHGRVTRGEPRMVETSSGATLDGQALLSWIGVAWVVLTSCQLAVTVAGNLAVLPLTGVTFPFVSFGMTSLLVNLAFLALCLNVNATSRDNHG